MNALIHPHTKKRLSRISAFTIAGLAALSLATGIGSANALANTEGCDSPASVRLITEQTKYTSTPGTTFTYYFEIKNNDATLCDPSSFTATVTGLPAGWTTSQTNDGLLNGGEYGLHRLHVTSPLNAYTGLYEFTASYARDITTSPDTSAAAFTLGYKINGAGPDAWPDVTAPNIGLISPTDGSTLKRKTTVPLYASVTDQVGIETIEFIINGVVICSGNSKSCSWTTPNTRTAVQLEVRATDTSGNVSTKTVSYQIR